MVLVICDPAHWKSGEVDLWIKMWTDIMMGLEVE